jgi:hypothetical protein
MDETPRAPRFETVPRRLCFSTLPDGQREFACFVRFSGQETTPTRVTEVSWTITATSSETASLTGRRSLTEEEQSANRFLVSAVLPASWGDSRLSVEMQTDQQVFTEHWTITHYAQNSRFDLPLAGQILVLVGHRIGDTHRSAWQLPAQQFAWDFLPLDSNGLRLLNTRLSDSLTVRDFVGFGQAVLAPAAGRVARVVDGCPDLEGVGAYPTDMRYYLEDLRRAAGNYLVIDHGDAVYSCLAHLRQGSINVQEGQLVQAGQVIGALGNSGFSSGPHLHLHFMDGPDLLEASPLPIALQVEGQALVPQAGDIITS